MSSEAMCCRVITQTGGSGVDATLLNQNHINAHLEARRVQGAV